MKMTEKTKRYLAVGGGAVICIALVGAIGLGFGKAQADGDALPTERVTATEIMVEQSKETEELTKGAETTEETETVIRPDSIQTEPEPGATKPVDTRPAQTDQPEQSIQPEVTKPAEPEKSVKTDPTQKPDGTKVETPPTSVDHEAVVTPTEPAPPANEPQGGDVQDGKTYLPGFGYIENSGSNQENYAEDMYENGNKIGNME